MKNAILALLWEMTWKNRVVLPALAVLWLLGGGLAQALAHAEPTVWWRTLATNIVLLSFAISVVLGYSMFSLMESHYGWRMNSMITRWLVLPVRTSLLVLLPFMAACVLLAGLVGLWMLALGRLTRNFDAVYFILTLVLGGVVMQAVAWTVPRRPTQFWVCFGVIVLASLLFGIIPQEKPDWAGRRELWLRNMAIAMPVLGFYAWFAARQLRCGNWSGEIPLHLIGQFLTRRRQRRRNFASAGTALFWSDAVPALRALALSWVGLALLLAGYVFSIFRWHRPEMAFSPKLLAFVAIDMLPFLGLFWLAVFGLFLGCEPASGFRTRFSHYRATMPISSGQYAGQRIGTLALGWFLIWAPLLGFVPWYTPEFRGVTGPDPEITVLVGVAWRIALSAHLAAGALPVYLAGRLEGFPNMLLTGISAWAVTWLMTGAFRPDPDHPEIGLGWLAVVILAVKMGLASWGCWQGHRRGLITWRFTAGLGLGWLAAVSVLIWVFPCWSREGLNGAVALALMMPLARLALCPIAIDVNRHR
jgi:hypothetical protein